MVNMKLVRLMWMVWKLWWDGPGRCGPLVHRRLRRDGDRYCSYCGRWLQVDTNRTLDMKTWWEKKHPASGLAGSAERLVSAAHAGYGPLGRAGGPASHVRTSAPRTARNAGRHGSGRADASVADRLIRAVGRVGSVWTQPADAASAGRTSTAGMGSARPAGPRRPRTGCGPAGPARTDTTRSSVGSGSATGTPVGVAAGSRSSRDTPTAVAASRTSASGTSGS